MNGHQVPLVRKEAPSYIYGMKTIIINSTFLLLSSTLATAMVAVVWQDRLFPVPEGQTAAALSPFLDEENELVFVSFEDILAKISKPSEATTTEDVELDEETIEPQPAANLAEAIVQVTCIQKTNKFKKTISGTGFFVSSRGIIVTNAHVAQFMLLRGIEDQGQVDCSASVGNTTHGIELLYLSPTWLVEHASLISDLNPKGSGENDFALLYVTDTDGKSFAHLPPATNPLPKSMKGDTVILVGYPKEGGTGSNKRTTATTSIRGLFTYEEGGYSDVISLEESPLGYNGASGGPVIDHLGRSIGMIATKSNSSTVLNAITMSHIDRSIKHETGLDLISILQSDLSVQAKLFKEVISPVLKEILAKNLE